MIGRSLPRNPADAGLPRSGVASGRDELIDAVRAYAIVGVVLGHWLVTVVVRAPDDTLRVESPLTTLPTLAPVTWGFQTLGLFFFAGGFAATRALTGRPAAPHGLARSAAADALAESAAPCALAGSAAPDALAGPRTAGSASGQLAAPERSAAVSRGGGSRRIGTVAAGVGLLLGSWGVALIVAAAAGTPPATLATVARLVASPLWFLIPFLSLGWLTGWLYRLYRRFGPGIIGIPVMVVVLADLGLGTLPTTLLAAWMVPWLLGVARARGRLAGPAVAWTLSIAGAIGMALLLRGAGYPESAVGVPGAATSNLNPPSLLAIALAVLQIGVALLIEQRHRPGPVWRRITSVLNGNALTIFLWHQTALLTVTLTAHAVPLRLSGLEVGPADDGAGWLVARLGSLPLVAAMLVTGVIAGRAVSRALGPAARGVFRRAGNPHRATQRRAAGVGLGRFCSADCVEVIAMRDSDPPSHSWVARQLP